MSIAAASVIAKVTRDRILYEVDQKHPEYGFKNHKGYPTKKHLEAINKYGLIDGYRKTYGPIMNYIKSGISPLWKLNLKALPTSSKYQLP